MLLTISLIRFSYFCYDNSTSFLYSFISAEGDILSGD
jgi:hypothetical protein